MSPFANGVQSMTDLRVGVVTKYSIPGGIVVVCIDGRGGIPFTLVRERATSPVSIIFISRCHEFATIVHVLATAATAASWLGYTAFVFKYRA